MCGTKLFNNKIAKSYLLLQKVDQSNKRTKNSATRKKNNSNSFSADDVILNVRKFLIFVVFVVYIFGHFSKISSNCVFNEIVIIRNDYKKSFFAR